MGKWIYAKLVCTLLCLAILAGPVSAVAAGSMASPVSIKASLAHSQYQVLDAETSRVKPLRHDHTSFFNAAAVSNRRADLRLRNSCCSCDQPTDINWTRADVQVLAEPVEGHAVAAAPAPVFSLLRPPRA